MLYVWYIYLQNWVIFRVNVGKYSSAMEHMRFLFEKTLSTFFPIDYGEILTFAICFPQWFPAIFIHFRGAKFLQDGAPSR